MPTESQKAVYSPWSPFRYRVFTVMWSATVISNIGTWMYNAAAGWLMTDLTTDALTISLVQVAANLPMFLFALPAGTLADILDKRKFLLASQIVTTVICAAFATLVWRNQVTPHLLLVFMFFIGAGGAFMIPAWQSIVPTLVPPSDLTPAVAANSAGVNISRAVGPALAGATIAVLGIAAPFWINAASNLATISALMWWPAPARRSGDLPPESFVGAMGTGVRHATHNPALKATIMRALAFFPFASAYWALLPLLARHQIAGGSELYGILLGAIGAGAVAGAFVLPRLKAVVGADWMAVLGTVATAAAMALFGVAREPILALAASIIAGIAWITTLASLNVSAQFALPDWVRARGLAIFVTVMFAAMTFGSALWGHVAESAGAPTALFAAAAGALLGVPISRRWKLQTGADLDLTPSMHWPTPAPACTIQADTGPVLVTVEYRLAIGNQRDVLITAIRELGRERWRDGAYSWRMVEDTAEPALLIEIFLVHSWLDHLRQHERVTNADRELQRRIRGLVAVAPAVRHLIAVRIDNGLLAITGASD